MLELPRGERAGRWHTPSSATCRLKSLKLGALPVVPRVLPNTALRNPVMF